MCQKQILVLTQNGRKIKEIISKIILVVVEIRVVSKPIIF